MRVYEGGGGNVSIHEMMAALIYPGKDRAIDPIPTLTSAHSRLYYLPADRRKCPSLASAPDIGLIHDA